MASGSDTALGAVEGLEVTFDDGPFPVGSHEEVEDTDHEDDDPMEEPEDGAHKFCSFRFSHSFDTWEEEEALDHFPFSFQSINEFQYNVGTNGMSREDQPNIGRDVLFDEFQMMLNLDTESALEARIRFMIRIETQVRDSENRKL
jgi:hypothetical protein